MRAGIWVVALCLSSAGNLAVALSPAHQKRTSAGSGDRQSPSARAQIDSGAAASASKVLDDTLVDYPSSRFRAVTLHGEPGRRMLCGQINTKNRAGGFGGWTNFRVAVDNDTMSQAEGLLIMQGAPTAVDRFVSQYGIGQPADRDSSANVIATECGPAIISGAAADYAGAITYKAR